RYRCARARDHADPRPVRAGRRALDLLRLSHGDARHTVGVCRVGGAHVSDHDEAVAALKRLGLSSYEAQVFIALQRLDTATVREVDRTTEVPRSQIYGAAEDLAERGLVDIQQSTP